MGTPSENHVDRYLRDTIYTILIGIKAKHSQMLVANPGTGKSALVRSLAEDWLGDEPVPVIPIVGSQKEPTDVTGFPRLMSKPLTDGTPISITSYAIPEWEFRILREKRIVLFLDEFSNSTPAVQAAMLQILNEREFPDGSRVPDETVIIGAMNPVATAADGYELGLPVSNRLKFIPWEPSFASWASNLLTNWGHPERTGADEAYWRRIIVRFLQRNPDLVYKLPDATQTADPGAVYGFGDSPAETDIFKMAYPTNRSWTNLCAELQYCRKSPTLMLRSANGIVGYEAAARLMEFLSAASSSAPKPENALRDPKSVPFSSLDANEIAGLLRGAIAVAGKTGAPDDATRLGHLFLACAKSGHAANASQFYTDAVKIIRRSPERDLVKTLNSSLSAIGELIGG